MRIQNLAWLIAAVLCLLLTACFPKGNAGVPIPKLLVSAPTTATRLVVVLPGRGDDLAAMQRTGMAEAIQAAWPDADVILTGLSYDYYMQGRAPERLHDEIVVPTRQKAYRQTWLVGASMGGMGTLMYDRAYPGEMDGLILLAPYLGDKSLLQEIAAAGGIARWKPGPVPGSITADNFQQELWRHLQGWSRDPAKAANVWLAYGDRDRLRKAMPFLEPLIPSTQVLVREGGHDWKVWSAATREIMVRAREEGVQRSP
ncbi:MAG: alpha/beta hydrolase-fold protein [Pseudoxanthomonas sp.]